MAAYLLMQGLASLCALIAKAIPGAPPIMTDRTDDWTISIKLCRSYFPISDLQNSYSETFSELLVLKFALSMSKTSPGVPSGALGTPRELIYVGPNRTEDVEINN